MSTATLPNIDPKLFDKSKWSDRVSIDGIFSKGFTTVPFSVVVDPRLSEDAFRLYSLYMGFAARGNGAMPRERDQRELLGLSEKQFARARNQLIDCGFISLEDGQIRIEAGDRR